jgi:hypothetical protein
MTKGMIFDPDDERLTIINGSRTVATSDGTLVNLLTTGISLTGQTATFPDFNKSDAYVWTTSTKNVPFSSPDKWQHGESCVVFITALPQEYSAVTALASVPDGADFFVGQVKLTRSTAPASTWMGRTIAMLPKSGQWLPIPGAFSALMEADVGMARALHFYIDDNPASGTYRKLVMQVQQSVGPAIGGYGSFGSVVAPTGGSANGGAVTAGGAGQGIPIAVRAGAKSYGYEPAGGDTTQFAIAYSESGGSPCARGDTTSYSDIYTFDLKGRFGRRS